MHTKFPRWILACLSMALMFVLMAIPAFAYAPHVDSSKFPHGTGDPINFDLYEKHILSPKLHFNPFDGSSVTFSTQKYPGAGGVPLNGTGPGYENATVFAVITESSATIYSKDGGGIIIPDKFSFCKGINDGHELSCDILDISGADTSQMANAAYMFYECKASKVKGLECMDTSNMVDMQGMFAGSNTYINWENTDVIFTNMDTSKVENMGFMFSGAKLKGAPNLSNFDTSKVTNMKMMFASMVVINRAKMDLTNFDTSKVTNMDGVFGGMSGVSTLDISSFDTANATSTTYMFASGNPKLPNGILEKVICRNEEEIAKYKATKGYAPSLKFSVKLEGIESSVSGGEVTTPVTLSTEEPIFSVTIPTGLPVAVDAEGNVTCASDGTAKIVNNTIGPVKVTSVTVSGDNGWGIVTFDTDMDKEKVNAKKIAFKINNIDATTLAAENFDVLTGINATSGSPEAALTYTAKIPAQTTALTGKGVANIVFTIGWDTAI